VNTQRVQKLVLAWFLGTLWVTGGCRDKDTSLPSDQFAIDQTYDKGPLSVHVRVDPNSLTIAQTLTLEFEAAIEPNYTLTLPKVDKVLENFGILDWSRAGDRLDDANRRVKTVRYELEPFLSGTYQLPAFTFAFSDVNDPNKTYTLDTEPIAVEVTSLLGEDRANLTIDDIDPVVAMPSPPVPRWVWAAISGGTVLAILGVWLVIRNRRQAQALVRIFKPAHEIAYDRLRALVAENLIEQGRIKLFYERISYILRCYIEHRFSMHAPERTTEEFLFELKSADVLAGPDKETLEHFLTHCDLVKFARHNPTDAQIQETFDLVKTFIEKTRSPDRQIDVTDWAPVQPSGEIA